MIPKYFLVGLLFVLVVSAFPQEGLVPSTAQQKRALMVSRQSGLRNAGTSPVPQRYARHGGLPELGPRVKAFASNPASNPIFLVTPEYDSGGLIPTVIAAADLNGDGKLDLVVANSNSNNVSVLIGKGDGTFLLAVSYPTGQFTTSVAIGDLNGDGIADLAVGVGGNVDVLVGNGDGTFQAPVSYDSGQADTPSIAIGDFNHDGKADLAIAHECIDNTCADGAVSILLGNGNGTFQPPATYDSGGEFALFVQAADFNGDGKLDLAVANASSSGNSTDIVGILLGNGDGTFQPAVSYNAAGYGNAFTISLAIGDFNGDGKLDLAVADFGDCGVAKETCPLASINILMGNGDGTFQPVASSFTGSDISAIVAADVNGDGKLDLVLSNFCGDALQGCGDGGTVSILLGNGDGTFQPALDLDGTGGRAVNWLAIGDFDRDGKLDLAMLNQSSLCCTDGSVGILLGNGDGTYQTTTSYPTEAVDASFIDVADFNGDGKLDLAVGSACFDIDDCGNSKVSVLLGNGKGGFLLSGAYEYSGGDFSTFPYVASGDFNHDGKLDLAVLGTNGQTGANYGSGVSVLMGNGDGTFQNPVVYSSGGLYGSWVGVGDFNGDGKLDLALGNGCTDSGCTSGSVSVLLGKGDGTFQAALTNASVGPNVSAAIIGDFNNDGRLDLAVLANNECTSSCPTSVDILLGKGDGTFQPAVPYNTGGTTGVSLLGADLNGDGRADLAVVNSCSPSNDCAAGIVGVLLGNGDGTFLAAVPYTTIQFPYSATLSDVNGDGQTDLVVSTQNSISVMFGNGDGSFQTPTTNYPVPGGGPVAADFNGDGKPDIAVADVETVSVLTNIATGFRYATSAVLTSSANPAALGQSVTFTATVTGVVSGAPTGNVTFNDGGNALGTAAVSAGKATLTTSSLAAGPHTITSSYGGDSTFLASTSPALVETVNVVADFSLASSALSPSAVNPGASSTSAVNVTAVNGFSGSVALACSVSPLPAHAPTCLISPASIAAGTAATLTVNTTAASSAAMRTGSGIFYAVGLPLLGLVLTGFRSRGKNSGRLLFIATISVLFANLMFLVACGGGSSGGGGGGNSGTPAGSYTITVTGVSGASQHSTTATLTVQ